VEAQEGRGEAFDTEVFVIDDASVDDTPDVVGRYPSVRSIRLQTSRGPAAARNCALRASTGAYVAFLDDDDSYLPHRLRAHVEALQANPGYGAVYGQLLYDGDAPYPDARTAPSGRIVRPLLMKEWIYTNVITIRRDALAVAGMFDEQLPTMEHHDLFLRLAVHVPIVFIPDVVARCEFSPRGFWFSSIVRGDYQRAVTTIVERVLAMLPPGEPVDELRRASAAAWFPTIAYWLEQAGATERLREHVIDSLTRVPALLTDPDRLFALHASRAAAAIAIGAPSSLDEVRSFCMDLNRAARDGPWLARRRLMARSWLAAAQALAELSRTAEARRAAIEAIHQYPVIGRYLNVFALVAPRFPGLRGQSAVDGPSPSHASSFMPEPRTLNEEAVRAPGARS
jgi:glycosyl transferase family 2